MYVVPGHDGLLRRILKVACRLRPLAKRLHRLHHLRLVGEKCVAELLRPFELVVHHRQHLREAGERHDARIPGLVLQRVFERVALQVPVLLGESRCLDHFERIGRGHQHLAQQLVGVERDRRQQRVELVLRQRRRAAVPKARRRRGWWCLRGNGERSDGDRCEQHQQKEAEDACHGVSLCRKRPPGLPPRTQGVIMTSAPRDSFAATDPAHYAL